MGKLACSVTGLSPRVRGNHQPLTVSLTRGRSIPAGAGEPHKQPEAGRRSTGLSPRVRGNRACHLWHKHSGGSIPAGAGEPRATGSKARVNRLGVRYSALCPVYPRGCGGTAFLTAKRLVGHPRGCGGIACPLLTAKRLVGLSPRVRGNLPAVVLRWSMDGLSPRVRGNHEKVSVYPRGCGGTSPFPSPEPLRRGLSPRVRGNRTGQSRRTLGSIPAGAGEPIAQG